MFSVQAMIQRLPPLTCQACRRFRGGRVRILASAVEPVNPDGEVVVKVFFRCPRCGNPNPVQTSLPAEQFAAVVMESLKTVACRMQYTHPLEVVVDPPAKPSIRPDTPAAPIGDAEVTRTLRLLKRTSFRRTTKSWRAFLDRLA